MRSLGVVGSALVFPPVFDWLVLCVFITVRFLCSSPAYRPCCCSCFLLLVFRASEFCRRRPLEPERVCTWLFRPLLLHACCFCVWVRLSASAVALLQSILHSAPSELTWGSGSVKRVETPLLEMGTHYNRRLAFIKILSLGHIRGDFYYWFSADWYNCTFHWGDNNGDLNQSLE